MGPVGIPCPACDGRHAELFFRKDGYELIRCDGCGLVRIANPPSREDIERLYSFESGYHVEALADGEPVAWVKRLAAYHLRLLTAEEPPGRLLDVGCGPGYFVSEALDAGWDASGVDLNRDAVQLAREGGLPVVEGRMESLPGEPGTFDAVTLWDSLEHIERPRETLQAVHALLRFDGVVAVSTPNLRGLYPTLSYPIGRITGYWTHPEPPVHLVQFSTLTLTSLLKRAGFDVVRIVHDRSPLKYTLAPGGLRRLGRSPGRALYAAVFLPSLLLGPHMRRGDAITVIARAR